MRILVLGTYKKPPEKKLDRIKTLCIKWEAIRRNPQYRKAVTSYDEQAAKLNSKIANDPADNDLMLTAPTYRRQLALKKKWNLITLIDPSRSFLRVLFPKGIYQADPVRQDELMTVFGYSRAVQHLPVTKKDCRFITKMPIEEWLSHGKEMFDLCAKTKSLAGHSKEIVREFTIGSFYIDITKPKQQIDVELSEILEEYQELRMALKLTKKRVQLPRFNIETNLKLFETYDLVGLHKKGSWVDWKSVARKRFPRVVAGLETHRIEAVKKEYRRALYLINEGFYKIG